MTDQFYQPAPDELVACDDGLHYILLDEANAHCSWVMRRHPDGGLVSVRKATEHELAHAKARQHLRAGVAQLEESKGQLPDQQTTKAGEPDLVAYHCVDQYGQKKVLLPGAEGIRRHILHGSVLKQLTYMDTACRLLTERDEGLERERLSGQHIKALEALNQQSEKQRDHWIEEHARLQQRLAEATDLLKHMTCSYHRALENGYDRIIFLGGDCDSVDKMEQDDPFYAKARAFLASPGCADGEKAE